MLREVFRALKTANPNLDVGSSVHGEFGTVDGWTTHASAVTQTLASLAPVVDQLLDALLVRASPDLLAKRTDIANWACGVGLGSLIAEIERALATPATSPDLSQHLAERGVLPMFGFPTRVRQMFLWEPKQPYPWPPRGTVDRQLELAVSDFAPLSETVRDKQVHTAVGLAAYRPTGNIIGTDNPIGRPQRISLCRRCGTVRRRTDEEAPIACEECSAGPPDFGVTQLSEPAGFRAAYRRPQDFEGSLTRSARSTTPRIAPDVSTARRTESHNAVALSGASDVYVVNDNGGQSYRFAPTPDRKTWVSVDIWNDQDQRTRLLREKSLLVDETWEGALGMVKRTDTMLLGPAVVPEGLDLRPYDPGRRAVWYSLGFLLRGVASRQLVIGQGELNVGYSVRHVDGSTHVELFLADALENGAGYCTRLGEPSELQSLLLGAERFASGSPSRRMMRVTPRVPTV